LAVTLRGGPVGGQLHVWAFFLAGHDAARFEKFGVGLQILNSAADFMKWQRHSLSAGYGVPPFGQRLSEFLFS